MTSRPGPFGRGGSFSSLDRGAYQVAPLGPRSVVVLALLEAEQIGEHEPGVRGALADSAVGDDGTTPGEPRLFLVDLLELVRALEEVRVGIGCPRPGDVLGTRDMAASERAFVRVVGHVEALAPVFLRAAHVHQRTLSLHVRHDVVAERPDARVVAGSHLDVAGGQRRHLLDERALLVHPTGAPAVDDLEVFHSEQAEHPEAVGRPPVVLVPIEHDGVVPVHPLPTDQRLELIAIQIVAGHLVIEVLDPIELLRPRDVPGVVEEHVFVRFEQLDLGVAQMVFHPGRGHEYFRVDVAARLDGLGIGHRVTGGEGGRHSEQGRLYPRLRVRVRLRNGPAAVRYEGVTSTTERTCRTAVDRAPVPPGARRTAPRRRGPNPPGWARTYARSRGSVTRSARPPRSRAPSPTSRRASPRSGCGCGDRSSASGTARSPTSRARSWEPILPFRACWWVRTWTPSVALRVRTTTPAGWPGCWSVRASSPASSRAPRSSWWDSTWRSGRAGPIGWGVAGGPRRRAGAASATAGRWCSR